MSRRNRGSILLITVFVFLLVNIIAINCSAIVMSNAKYTKYNYEEMYIKEQCLSEIELIYSNVLKEVDLALDESDNFNSFEAYFISNDSEDFINKISNISSADLKDTKCQIDRVNLEDKNCIYYKIISDVRYDDFSKRIVAYIKVKNPFDENSENKDIKASDLVTIFDFEEV